MNSRFGSFLRAVAVSLTFFMTWIAQAQTPGGAVAANSAQSPAMRTGLDYIPLFQQIRGFHGVSEGCPATEVLPANQNCLLLGLDGTLNVVSGAFPTGLFLNRVEVRFTTIAGLTDRALLPRRTSFSRELLSASTVLARYRDFFVQMYGVFSVDVLRRPDSNEPVRILISHMAQPTQNGTVPNGAERVFFDENSPVNGNAYGLRELSLDGFSVNFIYLSPVHQRERHPVYYVPRSGGVSGSNGAR